KVSPGIIPAKQGNSQLYFNKFSNSRYAFSGNKVEIPEIVGGGVIFVGVGVSVGKLSGIDVACGKFVLVKINNGSAVLGLVLQEIKKSDFKVNINKKT